MVLWRLAKALLRARQRWQQYRNDLPFQRTRAARPESHIYIDHFSTKAKRYAFGLEHQLHATVVYHRLV
jgi:hypothetical protein